MFLIPTPQQILSHAEQKKSPDGSEQWFIYPRSHHCQPAALKGQQSGHRSYCYCFIIVVVFIVITPTPITITIKSKAVVRRPGRMCQAGGSSMGGNNWVVQQ